MIVIDVVHARRYPRALFLDRDGVINVDHGWVHRRENFEWVDGIFELARAAHAARYAVVVVTNQGGIARGHYDEDAFRGLSRWMIDGFARDGVPITRVIGCPHHPDGRVGRYSFVCACRKPAPGMLLRTATDLDIDLASSIMVGDKPTDMEAAKAAGIPTRILLGAAPTIMPDRGLIRVESLRQASSILFCPDERLC